MICDRKITKVTRQLSKYNKEKTNKKTQNDKTERLNIKRFRRTARCLFSTVLFWKFYQFTNKPPFKGSSGNHAKLGA